MLYTLYFINMHACHSLLANMEKEKKSYSSIDRHLLLFPM